ncbi:QacE family quaternary ammonium compound efflux SMR transporter [Cohnella sp. CIP 111063]|uniref:DMT family transporter n=1 Tax=unclassified Cohnella TaxID=2636738 RepID=UPI000B8C2757|nr:MULTISPECIES: multidrug efflux SMR transporter [unclassified Cohnella]OXS60376.1 QacE family quaternary ammonium compound efflux SMR transporter [Cohnella sp. CIP 111063]PRX73074.1 paired small multidrug resistance pump [Cohnella sp. SGD-V74]
MDWGLLIAAGLLEVVGVIGIKRVAQNNNWTNNIILIAGFVISFQLLIQAMETIPLATAYAVWTGIGTVGAAVVGMIFFKEPKSWLRIGCILGIIFSVVGLKLVS